MAQRQHPDTHDSLHMGIVDNDPLVLAMLERNFATSGAPIIVLWTATDGADALRRCMSADAADRPDLLLTDLQMPGMNGAELVRRIHVRFPDLPIVGITAFLTDLTEADCHAAGLAAVLDKTTPARAILAELARISNNASLVAWAAQQDAARELSAQELEVMRLYVDGGTNEAIARRMNVSLTTVKTYARRAFDKLGVHSRTEAAIACLRRGLI